MTTAVEFWVYDLPQPGGSKRAFVPKNGGRPVVVEDCKRNKTWRTEVKAAALKVAPASPLTGPLLVEVTFFMPRPKGHFGTGKNADVLKLSAPDYHTSKPDATKLWRSTEDALTGILWGDDSQIAKQSIVKKYTNSGRPGAFIRVRRLMDRADLAGLAQ